METEEYVTFTCFQTPFGIVFGGPELGSSIIFKTSVPPLRR